MRHTADDECNLSLRVISTRRVRSSQSWKARSQRRKTLGEITEIKGEITEAEDLNELPLSKTDPMHDSYGDSGSPTPAQCELASDAVMH